MAERELGTLAQEHADPVALVDTLRDKPVGEPRARREKLAEGPVAHRSVGVLDNQRQRLMRMALAHGPADVETLWPGPAELPHRLFVGNTAGDHDGGTLWQVDHPLPAEVFCIMAPDDHSYAPATRGPEKRDKPAESGVTIVPSVCPHDCTRTCALDVERLDAKRIGRVRGSMRNDYTAGVICEKVARYAERVHHPDRLMKPLRRVGPKGSRQFAEISWADALDIVAEQFIAKARQHGNETVWPYYYAGTMGLVQRDGINRLRHAMKYSRYFSTICVTLSDTGWIAGVGAKRGADVREVDQHSDLVVIWGGNPVNTQVNVMTHAMRARKRGAKLVVVDPYRTGTAEQADIHLAVRPGTDGALAVAVMHVLFKEGFADWDYLRHYTDAPDELAAHVATRTPEWASKITGLSVDEIVSFARLYGQAKASFIRCHHGFSRSRNGAANMHAVTSLPAVTGAWKYKGGGALYGHTGMYPINRALIEGLDVVDTSIRELDQSRLGPILTGDREALKDGPPVTALLVQNTNPAMVCPELELVHQGFKREDLFTCVHEQTIDRKSTRLNSS